ncbi:hypothetical protein U91I_01978 [alpha proteobacterium U9-1i]|nr:hypothetical protein U91I_01978 [alpha proteobacterium U9-1i]
MRPERIKPPARHAPRRLAQGRSVETLKRKNVDSHRTKRLS